MKKILPFSSWSIIVALGLTVVGCDTMNKKSPGSCSEMNSDSYLPMNCEQNAQNKKNPDRTSNDNDTIPLGDVYQDQDYMNNQPMGDTNNMNQEQNSNYRRFNGN